MEDFDISSILQSLSPQDIDQLKSVAANFLGTGNEEPKAHVPVKEESSSPLSGLNLDPSMILKIGSLMQQFQKEDERCAFLNSLKPLISEQRRARVDQAAKLLKLLTILPHIKDIGLF